MITKFKIFENLLDIFNKKEFNIGDYVLVNTDKTDLPIKKICKIVDKKDNMYGVKSGPNKMIWWIFKNIIIRKLTPEEIEKIDINLNVNKYNL